MCKIIILFLCRWTLMYFNSTDRFCISFLQPVCRCFCSRLSERFLCALRDLVATTTKMHIDWFITFGVSSRLRKPHSAKSYFYQKATFALVLIISWRWVLVVLVIYAVSFEASAFACSLLFSKTFSFCFICRGWVCAVFTL